MGQRRKGLSVVYGLTGKAADISTESISSQGFFRNAYIKCQLHEMADATIVNKHFLTETFVFI